MFQNNIYPNAINNTSQWFVTHNDLSPCYIVLYLILICYFLFIGIDDDIDQLHNVVLTNQS